MMQGEVAWIVVSVVVTLLVVVVAVAALIIFIIRELVARIPSRRN
jgi:hypothetical protein